jgi:O-acetylhomoserine (thiol)-lyase
MMKKQTQAIHTQFQRRDAYNSLSMPVYHTAAYEFDNADDMADAFCGRTDAPDYSRVMNPTVTFFENIPVWRLLVIHYFQLQLQERI